MSKVISWIFQRGLQVFRVVLSGSALNTRSGERELIYCEPVVNGASDDASRDWHHQGVGLLVVFAEFTVDKIFQWLVTKPY